MLQKFPAGEGMTQVEEQCITGAETMTANAQLQAANRNSGQHGYIHCKRLFWEWKQEKEGGENH